MKTRILIAVVLGLVGLVGAGAQQIPVMSPPAIEFSGRVALLMNTKWFDPMLEIQGHLEGPDKVFRYRAITVGSYVRPLPNLKLGVFYRLQAGVRHDDDWQRTGDTGTPWAWADTTGRAEHQLVVDISPRFLLPFLPGGDWVFMLKTRYHLSSQQLLQSILVRPTLSWFLMVDRMPVLTVAAAYGLYFPLNFGTFPLYQHGPYVEVLYHLGRFVKLELTGAWKAVIWSASRELLDSGVEIPDGTFPLRYHAAVIGLGILVSVAP
jgi:hypothetical protein